MKQDSPEKSKQERGSRGRPLLALMRIPRGRVPLAHLRQGWLWWEAAGGGRWRAPVTDLVSSGSALHTHVHTSPQGACLSADFDSAGWGLSAFLTSS